MPCSSYVSRQSRKLPPGEAATMVEAKLYEKPSGTLSGVYGNNNACKNQCIRLEGAQHGSCNYVFPAHKCICYFPC
ncbi:Defensin-like protein [Thalictrum thalictroides]|uniref:Defensin-like protein n=1 Tax=Thalictrum thalictroides TaxID=46969 RepID=A0A7J6V4D2_THATH|nr:Defensin-like protein [Thalictrum thalictroides]